MTSRRSRRFTASATATTKSDDRCQDDLGPGRQRPAPSRGSGDVLLGEDWVSPDADRRSGCAKAGAARLHRRSTARRWRARSSSSTCWRWSSWWSGVLFMNPFRDSLVLQRESGLVTEAELIASCSRRSSAGPARSTWWLATGSTSQARWAGLELAPGVEVFVFDPIGTLVASKVGSATACAGGPGRRSLHHHHRFSRTASGTACRSFSARAARGAVDRRRRASRARTRTPPRCEGGTRRQHRPRCRDGRR